jgi:hypothetical protein
MLVIPGTAQAQEEAQTIIGGLGAYNTEGDGVFGLGAFGSIPLPQLHPNVSINPSFVLYFPEVGTLWEVNGDVVYRFDLSGDQGFVPFALGGINIYRFSYEGFSSTDIGLNLGGGLIFPMESIRPVAGAKFEIQDGTAFVIFGGIGFPVG